MSSDNTLLIRLFGPLQSWGTASTFSLRKTGLMPSRSAIAGMCCAALGLSRGSEEEKQFLKQFVSLKMKVVAVEGQSESKKTSGRSVRSRRITDFHTVLGTIKADGGKNNAAVVTEREYVVDAKFFVFLTGEKEFISTLSKAIENPTWGIFLGRKACIPSAPVFAGIYETIEQAEKVLEKENLSQYIIDIETDDFSKATDSIMDAPVNFESTNREFAIRQITRTYL